MTSQDYFKDTEYITLDEQLDSWEFFGEGAKSHWLGFMFE